MMSKIMIRSTIKRLPFQRFSTAATRDPKYAIFENFMKLSAITDAKSEAAIDTAVKSTKIDLNSLPEDLKDVDFGSSLKPATSQPFVPDPTAWQNKSFMGFFAEESSRPLTFHLFIGGLITFVGFYYVLRKAQTPELAKKSNYLKLLERNTGKAKAHESHAH